MKKKVLIPIIIGVVVLLLSVMTVLGCTVWKDPICRTFLSPEKYAQHVIKENSSVIIEQLAKGYERAVLVYSDNIQGNSKVTVRFSEDTLDDLAEYLDTDELGIMTNLSVEIVSNVKGMMTAYHISLLHEDTKFVSGEIILDMEEDIVYFRSEELNAPWAYIKLRDMMDSDEVNELEASLLAMTTMSNSLPSAAQISKLMNRYVAVMANEITDVEKSRETLEAGDLEQKCTVLEIDITENLVKNIARAFAEEVINDKDLEEYVVNFCDAYEDMDSLDIPEGDDAWDEIVDEMKEMKSEAREIDFDSVEYLLCLYVDNRGDIKGFRFEMEEKEYDALLEVEALQVVRGKNYAAEITLECKSVYTDEKMKFTVDGTRSGNKVTGDCKLSYEGISYKFRIEDLDWSRMFEGTISGKIYIKGRLFGDILEYTLGYYTAEKVSDLLQDSEICFYMDTTCGNGKTGLAIMEDEEELCAIEFESVYSSGGSVTIPEDAERLRDEEDLRDYVDDMDFDEVLDTMEELGTPEEILDELFESIY
ncbi:MAG: hypothetical protein ACI4DU_05510 [Lachnospiraceae bacterium]